MKQNYKRDNFTCITFLSFFTLLFEEWADSNKIHFCKKKKSLVAIGWAMTVFEFLEGVGGATAFLFFFFFLLFFLFSFFIYLFPIEKRYYLFIRLVRWHRREKNRFFWKKFSPFPRHGVNIAIVVQIHQYVLNIFIYFFFFTHIAMSCSFVFPKG